MNFVQILWLFEISNSNLNETAFSNIIIINFAVVHHFLILQTYHGKWHIPKVLSYPPRKPYITQRGKGKANLNFDPLPLP